MKFKKQPGIINAESEICPHLALKGDKESFAAFPSSINACYHGNAPTAPKFSHQRTYCLSLNHVDCTFYKNETIKKFPKELRFRDQRYFGKIKSILFLGIFGILTVLVIFQIAFRGGWVSKLIGNKIAQTQKIDLPAAEEESTGTSKISSVVETEIATQSNEVLKTKSPGVEPTSGPDPILDLDTPIGGEQKFIIHRVLEGESLQYLADRYGTSPQAILTVNDNIISPLWVGWIVVIPMETTDVEGFPSFSAYQIDIEGITLERFAAKLDIPPEELSLYNNIEEEHILHHSEWLIIPRN